MIDYFKYPAFVFGCLGLATTVFTDEDSYKSGGALDNISLSLSYSWLLENTENDYSYWSQSDEGDTHEISEQLTFSQKHDSASIQMLGVEYRLMSTGSIDFSLTLDLASFETTVKSDSAIANSIGIDINSSALMAGVQMRKSMTLFGKDAFIGVYAKRGVAELSDDVSEVSFEIAEYAYEQRGALGEGHVLSADNTYYLVNPELAGKDHNFDGDYDDTGVAINNDGDYEDRKYLADIVGQDYRAPEVGIDYNGDGDYDDLATSDLDGDDDISYKVFTEVYIVPEDINGVNHILVPLANNAQVDNFNNTTLEPGADGNIDWDFVDTDGTLGPDEEADFTLVPVSSTNDKNIYVWEGNVDRGLPVDENGDGDVNDIAVFISEAVRDFDINNDGDLNDAYDSGLTENQLVESVVNEDVNGDGFQLAGTFAAGVFHLPDNTYEFEFGDTLDVDGNPRDGTESTQGATTNVPYRDMDGSIPYNYFINPDMRIEDEDTGDTVTLDGLVDNANPSLGTLLDRLVNEINHFDDQQVILAAEATDDKTVTGIEHDFATNTTSALSETVYEGGTGSIVWVNEVEVTMNNGQQVGATSGFNDWNNNGILDLNHYYFEHPDEVAPVAEQLAKDAFDGNQDGTIDANNAGEGLGGQIAQSTDSNSDDILDTNVEFAPDVAPLAAAEVEISIDDLEDRDGNALAAGDTVTVGTRTVLTYDTDNSGDHKAVKYTIAPAGSDVDDDGDSSNDFIVTKETVTEATDKKNVAIGGTDGWNLVVGETHTAPAFTYEDVAPITENTDLVYGVFLGMDLNDRFSIAVGISHYDGGELRIDMSETSDAGNEAVFENSATLFDIKLNFNLGS